MKKQLTGPRNIKLELDSAEIYPDDPGQGTPAMVEYKGGVGTLNCVEGEGYVDGGRKGDISVPQECMDWLASDKVQDEVEAMYEAGPNGGW